MIVIVKHGERYGKHAKKENPIKFHCTDCGCEFTASTKDFVRVGWGLGGEAYDACACPECGKRTFYWESCV